MKKFILLCIFISSSILAGAQQPFNFIFLPSLDSTTQKNTMLRLPDGGLLFVTTQSGVSGSGTTVIKTDSSGNPLSAAQFAETISKAERCSDGGFLMFNLFSPVIIKTDSMLNILWAKKLAPVFPGLYFSSAIEQDGVCYVSASAAEGLIDPNYSFYGTYAAIIFKFDAAGNFTGYRILADTTYSSSRYNLYQPTLSKSADGNLYMSSSLLQYWAAGTCNRQPGIIKLDTALNLLWSKIYVVNIFNGVSGLKMLDDGNLALYGDYGNHYPFCNYFHPYLQKIDTAGNIIFAKEYHHPFPANHGTGTSMIEMEDHSMIFTRVFEDTVLNRYVPYLDHINPDGSVRNSKACDFPYTASYYSMSIAEEVNGQIPLSRMNSRDSLLFLSVDTSLTAYCGTVPNVTEEANVVITQANLPLTYLNYTFVFVDTAYAPFQSVPVTASPACNTTFISSQENEDNLFVYPNPAENELGVRFPIGIGAVLGVRACTITVYNLIGEKIPAALLPHDSYRDPNSLLQTLDVHELPPGMYILEVAAPSKLLRTKFLIADQR